MESSIDIGSSTVVGWTLFRGGRRGYQRRPLGSPLSGNFGPRTMRQYRKRSIYMARENIKTLLERKRMTIKEVSNMLGHDKSWLSKILKSDEAQDKDPNSRGVSLEALDELAKFFGVEPYQLLMPGMSALLERRQTPERRRIPDRRDPSRDIVSKVERRAQEVGSLLRVKGE